MKSIKKFLLSDSGWGWMNVACMVIFIPLLAFDGAWLGVMYVTIWCGGCALFAFSWVVPFNKDWDRETAELVAASKIADDYDRLLALRDIGRKYHNMP